MALPAENPFTALTIVVAPAILTNASSLLCFGTANRLSRVMDRARAVSAQLAGEGLNEGNRAMYEHQLKGLEVRWNLILRAMRCFYMSLGSFTAAALISLFGSMPVFSVLPVGFIAIAVIALSSGTVGVGGLVAGCAMMMRETRLAVQSLAEETQLAAQGSNEEIQGWTILAWLLAGRRWAWAQGTTHSHPPQDRQDDKN